MNDTLTEIDRISATATRLDTLLAGVEDNAIRTVAIHLFVQLTDNNHTVEIAKLSAQTDLSRREVKRALYALTLTGKVQRIGSKPRPYRLIKGAQYETCNTGSDAQRVAGLQRSQRRLVH